MKSVFRTIAGLAVAFSTFGQIAQAQRPPVPNWVPKALIYEVNFNSISPEHSFKSVETRLPDIQKLGVTTVWLMPIHPIGQLKAKPFHSSYAVRDYYGINPDLGTAADLHHLVDAVHRRHMKIILDMVFDHTAWDNPMITQHPDWYQHDAQGNIMQPAGTDWYDVAGLDYSKPGLRTYMTNVLTYWVREFHVDGFRCDAAGMVPTDFWEQARAAVDQVDPNALMLAEAEKPDLLNNAFDVDYDWRLLHAFDDVINSNHPATDIRYAWTQERDLFPAGALHMQISDDHDQGKRSATLYGPNGSLAVAAIIFTLNGVPLVYNGMEVLDPGSGENAWTAGPIQWTGQRQQQTYAFYQQLAALRAKHPALQQGQLTWLSNTDEAHVVSYERTGRGEDYVVVVNMSNLPSTVTVTTTGSGAWHDVTPVMPGWAATGGAASGTPASLTLPAFGFRIFSR